MKIFSITVLLLKNVSFPYFVQSVPFLMLRSQKYGEICRLGVFLKKNKHLVMQYYRTGYILFAVDLRLLECVI